MKKINILLLLLLCAFVSCTETDDDDVTPTTTDLSTPVNLNALIVGKWQLAEIGKVNTTTNSGSGCNTGGSSTHDEISWSRSQSTEVLDFKENGDFTRDLNKDAVCKGSYRINFNNLVTKSDCSQNDGEQPIDALNKFQMTLTVMQDNEAVKYKYVKM